MYSRLQLSLSCKMKSKKTKPKSSMYNVLPIISNRLLSIVRKFVLNAFRV